MSEARHTDINPEIDYRAAFRDAPVAMAVSHDRSITECNTLMLEMFRTEKKRVLGVSFKILYPTQTDFENTGRRTAVILGKTGKYANDRIMRRMDGDLFWCYITGYTFNRKDPYSAAIWSFMDLSSTRSMVSSMHVPLTPREREICTLLVDDKTSKEIGRKLAISPRTVDAYRASLMRKYSVGTTAELIQKVLHSV